MTGIGGELAKRLNLLHSNPDFAVQELPDGAAKVLRPSKIPDTSGIWWVAGQTTLSCGQDQSCVMVIDTDAGAELMQVYWHVDAVWWSSSDQPAVFDALGMTKDQVFPFDWRYHIPTERDIFHP